MTLVNTRKLCLTKALVITLGTFTQLYFRDGHLSIF